MFKSAVAAAALFGLALPAALRADGRDGLPRKAPTSVGMSAERLEAIDRVVERGITAGGYPGAAVVVGRKGAAVWERGFGSLAWRAGSPEVSAHATVYDLASLTKVVGTTTAVMLLFDEGRLRLDDPVAKYLPSFAGGYKDSVTVRHLLTHRSGLPPGRDLWRIAHTPQDARNAVLATPLACKPGVCFQYSDLGADVLGFVAEAVAGEPLDLFLDRRVWKPLGMLNTGFRPSAAVRERVAPTEVTPPRGYPLQGEVHDENAYALGGVAGHAGLFSTAADLSVFAQMMLNGGTYDGVRVLADSTVSLFTRRAAGTRALGWDTCDGNGGCGQHLGETAYGHLGFTGTSLWIDPDRELFVILLTNRVHAARARRPSKVISDVRADLADAAVLAVVDDPSSVLAMPASFRADRAEGWNAAERRAAASRSRSARSRAARARAARSRAVSSRSGRSTARDKSTARASTRGRAAAPSRSTAARSRSTAAAKSRGTAARGRTAPAARGRSTPAAKSRSGRAAPTKRPAARSATAAKRRR